MSTVPVPAASAPAAPTAAPADLLPAGIEIFRAGRHTDDAGRVHEFSEGDVRRMAAAYDPAQREAPLTVGHPAHDLPAYGFVKSLAVNAAGRLTMDAHQVAPQFAEMVKAGRFKKRSAAFYAPNHPNNPVPGAWYLRHVAFLGAQPPAIAGLADIAFADGGAGLVAFSEDAGSPDPEPIPASPVNPITPTNPQKDLSPMPTDNTSDANEVADLKRKLQAAQDPLMATGNLFRRLVDLLPDEPLLVASVTAQHADGTATVQFPGGGAARVRDPLGSAPDAPVFIQGNVITGPAPESRSTTIWMKKSWASCARCKTR